MIDSVANQDDREEYATPRGQLEATKQESAQLR